MAAGSGAARAEAAPPLRPSLAGRLLGDPDLDTYNKVPDLPAVLPLRLPYDTADSDPGLDTSSEVPTCGLVARHTSCGARGFQPKHLK